MSWIPNLERKINCNHTLAPPGDELGPNVRPQTIAKHQPDLVALFFRAGGRVYQVAADLPDVLGCSHLFKIYSQSKTICGKPRYLVLDTVFPVVWRREFIPGNHEACWMCGTKSYLMTIVMPAVIQPLRLTIPPTLDKEAVVKSWLKLPTCGTVEGDSRPCHLRAHQSWWSSLHWESYNW